jgi:hypothetical protein
MMFDRYSSWISGAALPPSKEGARRYRPITLMIWKSVHLTMPMYVSLIFHYRRTRGTIARSIRTSTSDGLILPMSSMIEQPLLYWTVESTHHAKVSKPIWFANYVMVCANFCSEKLFYRLVLQLVCSQYELPQNSAPNTESSCLPAFEFVSGRFFQNDVSKILLHKRVSMVHHLLL